MRRVPPSVRPSRAHDARSLERQLRPRCHAILDDGPADEAIAGTPLRGHAFEYANACVLEIDDQGSGLARRRAHQPTDVLLDGALP